MLCIRVYRVGGIFRTTQSRSDDLCFSTSFFKPKKHVRNTFFYLGAERNRYIDFKFYNTALCELLKIFSRSLSGPLRLIYSSVAVFPYCTKHCFLSGLKWLCQLPVANPVRNLMTSWWWWCDEWNLKHWSISSSCCLLSTDTARSVHAPAKRPSRRSNLRKASKSSFKGRRGGERVTLRFLLIISSLSAQYSSL